MSQAASTLTLKAFLAMPETTPASEFVDGQIFQKPMPKGKHSRLQLKLCDRINEKTETRKIAFAFPKLRCSFGTRSVVPDISVFYWSRIEFDDIGEPQDDGFTYPDWVIEILLPDQRPNRVIDNIVYCLNAGTRLGWLVDPEDRTVTVYRPNQLPVFCKDLNRLDVLDGIELSITTNQLFSLLRMEE